MTKRSGVVPALALAIVGASAAFSGAEPLELRDSIVAVVNNEAITRKDLVDRASPAIAALDSSLAAAERQERIKEILATALRATVDEKLMVAEANRLLKANETFKKRFEDRVSIRVEEERRRAGGEVPFLDSIRKQGLTRAEFVERLRAQAMQEFILYQFVLRDLTASPSEVLEYYKQNLGQFEEAAQAKYRQIFVRVDGNRTREQARELADYILTLLKKQHDFAPLAEKYSDGPHAKEGGLWDFTNKGARPKPIDELLFSLPIGEIGGPAETEIGFTIVKVEERKAGRTKPFEEVQSGIEAKLISQKRMSRYAALIHRLEEENYVEVLP